MCALHLRSSSPWRQPCRISQVVLFLRRHTTCESPSGISMILESESATHQGPLTPDTHQNGTADFIQCKSSPNVYAAVLDCSRVALHVQALTLLTASIRDTGLAKEDTHIPQQTKPGLTLLEAVCDNNLSASPIVRQSLVLTLNSSAFEGEMPE